MPEKTRYRVKGSKVVHEDKNCSYLDETDKDSIAKTKAKGYDKCPRCTEKGR